MGAPNDGRVVWLAHLCSSVGAADFMDSSKMSEKQRFLDAVNEMWTVLRAMDSPRDGARALACVHLMMMEAEGVSDEAGVRARLKESDAAIIDTWRDRRGLDITH